jgi:tRNA dimethylallyltransferase
MPNDLPKRDAADPERSEPVLRDYALWIQPPLARVWYLTGPTASGKTPLAVGLAKRLEAEIISLDSMAIYRGMDIGTAKPTVRERAEVPHHLLDIIEPTDNYSLSNFVLEAHRVAAEIWSRGKNVLVCGGTPLYLKSLMRGLFLGPAADWEFRRSVEADVEAHGIEALRQRLKHIDPLLAHKLHPNDQRRMIRGLEVARATGRPLSHWQEQFEQPASAATCTAVVLRLERSWLHERINQRVEEMLQAGLQGEVEVLVERHRELGRTAQQAVGYREVLQHLRGEISAEELPELIKAHTRQFARRQEIWFRGLAELRGLTVAPDIPFERLLDELVEIYSQAPQPQRGQHA